MVYITQLAEMGNREKEREKERERGEAGYGLCAGSRMKKSERGWVGW